MALPNETNEPTTDHPTDSATLAMTDPAIANMPGCLFCRIVTAEIPATVVATNDHAIAFRDLNPTAPTHVLVIPKIHIANADEVRSHHGAVMAGLFGLAQEVARIEGLSERGYRLVLNVGEDSGNSVAHLHLHVVGGRRMGWPPFAS
jgi:histidine triad (HIT) family protein